jgi:hypothetical protein
VSTTVGSHLRLGAQAFAQRLGNYGDDKVILDWAVADYNFRQEFGVRVGRIKYPRGLYGEALDLDVLRPFIFLPLGNYDPVLRDFASSFDGAMIYGTLSAAAAGSFDYKVFYGDIKMNTNTGVSDYFTATGLFAGAGVSTLGVDHVNGVAVDWTTPVSGLKLHLSYSELTKLQARGNFAPAPVLPFLLQVTVAYTSIGAEYTVNDWTFAAEWLRQDGDSVVQALPILNNAGKFGSSHSYVSVARRFGAKWEVGGYYSYSEDRFPTPGTPDAANEQKDLAMCARYNVNEHLILKIEHHWIDGYTNMLNSAKTPNPTYKGKSSFFAAKATLLF